MADLSAAARDRAEQRGQAMEGGRFPIRNRADLANAIRAVGRVRPATEEARSEVRRWIIRRARALGAVDAIPDTWDLSTGQLKASS